MRERLLRNRSIPNVQNRPHLPCVTLGRGKEVYIFRYRKGREAELIATMVEFARNKDLGFSWDDLILILKEMRL